MPGPRQDLRQALQRLAFDQAGYFTAKQAISIGYSYQAQKYHVDHGNWLRIDRGLFRLPHWPPATDDAFIRWSLWADGRGVVSHESALAVHELSDLDPTHVHLTVAPDFRARDSAVIIHLADLDAAAVEDRGAWKVTTPVRTLIDAAATDLSQEHIDAAVGDALRSGKITRRVLRRATEGASAEQALKLERALKRMEDESE
jgi:predicted transcriptional regulator of viral defense system